MIRFVTYTFDPGLLELWQGERRVRLAPQPARVLKLLLETPGQLVTRERLREELWPAGTFVEFDLALNAAVNRLRRVLGDTSQAPRFIVTVPRVGYRFISPVEIVAEAGAASEVPSEPAEVAVPVRRGWKRNWVGWLLTAAVLLGILAAFYRPGT